MKDSYEHDQTHIRPDYRDNEPFVPITTEQRKVLLDLQPLFFKSGLAAKFNEFHKDKRPEVIGAELPFAIAQLESVLEEDRNKLLPYIVKINHQTGEVLHSSTIDLGEINTATGERKISGWDGHNVNFDFNLEDLGLAEQIYRSQEGSGLDIWIL